MVKKQPTKGSPHDLGADLGRVAAEMGISQDAWKQIRAGALFNGEARLWLDVDPPRRAVLRLPGPHFGVSDESWARIEELLGQCDTRVAGPTDDYWLNRLIGATATMRETVNNILSWYIARRDGHVHIPELRERLRRRLKQLYAAEELFANADEDTTDYLKKIFTHDRNTIRNPDFRIADETREELEMIWQMGVRPKQIHFFIAAYRKNVERVLDQLPNSKPTDWDRKELGRRLAGFWTEATGAPPTSGRHPETSEQTGAFAAFYRILDDTLPEGFKIPDRENAIREAVDELSRP